MPQQRSWRSRLTPLPYLLPALLSISVLSMVPILYTVYISFTNYSGQRLFNYGWVGLRNYLEILTGPSRQIFFPVLGWTIVFAVLSVVTQYTAGLFLAVLLNNRHMRESHVYRAVLILPWMLPAAIMTMSFVSLLNTGYGRLNYLLGALFQTDPIPWLTDPTWARISVLLVSVWFGYPWFMTVLLGGLQSIPTEMYEAAEIDGASRWQQFTRITMPRLWTVSYPVVISSAAYNFNNFGAAYLLTGGGPPRATATWGGYTDILASVGFKLVHDSFLYGLASALSVLLFVLVAGFSLFNLRFTRAFAEVD